MKNKINWNPKNKALLETMYDQGVSDKIMTSYFGCGAWAVAKQRSILGLTKFKKKKGLHHASRVPASYDTSYSIMKYSLGGQLHYGQILKGREQETASNVLDRNPAISVITILKPTMVVTRTEARTL